MKIGNVILKPFHQALHHHRIDDDTGLRIDVLLQELHSTLNGFNVIQSGTSRFMVDDAQSRYSTSAKMITNQFPMGIIGIK